MIRQFGRRGCNAAQPYGACEAWASFASRQWRGCGSIGRSGVELEGFAGFAGGLYVGGRMVLERNGERD